MPSHLENYNPKFTLSELQLAYEYLFDLSAEDAALRVGMRPAEARRLISSPRFQEIIQLFSARRQTRNEIYADAVLQRLWSLANADPRSIVEIHVGPCRYCWGTEHQYQYIDIYELEEARTLHLRKEESFESKYHVEFNDIGGVGYTLLRPPFRDCPRCGGNGVPRGTVKDSRYYTESAKALYDGVKIGKDGSVEIKFRDRSWALEKVAQHLGMFIKRQAITILDPSSISDDQLDNVLRQYGHLIEGQVSSNEITDEVSSSEAVEASLGSTEVPEIEDGP
jgi:phage terminase small subunit